MTKVDFAFLRCKFSWVTACSNYVYYSFPFLTWCDGFLSSVLKFEIQSTWSLPRSVPLYTATTGTVERNLLLIHRWSILFLMCLSGDIQVYLHVGKNVLTMTRLDSSHSSVNMSHSDWQLRDRVCPYSCLYLSRRPLPENESHSWLTRCLFLAISRRWHIFDSRIGLWWYTGLH